MTKIGLVRRAVVLEKPISQDDKIILAPVWTNSLGGHFFLLVSRVATQVPYGRYGQGMVKKKWVWQVWGRYGKEMGGMGKIGRLSCKEIF